MDVSIDLLIKDVIGPVTTGFASLIIFAEMPSKPVAFFIFNLFICLSTKVGVTGLNVKVSVFVLGLFVFIACILGWFSSITVFGFPIFLATFMKKSLKISDTFLGSFTMSLFSLKVIELFVFTPLLDKKGFIVGQKSLDFGPPAHLS